MFYLNMPMPTPRYLPPLTPTPLPSLSLGTSRPKLTCACQKQNGHLVQCVLSHMLLLSFQSLTLRLQAHIVILPQAVANNRRLKNDLYRLDLILTHTFRVVGRWQKKELTIVLFFTLRNNELSERTCSKTITEDE